jgi:hypothetical protein
VRNECRIFLLWRYLKANGIFDSSHLRDAAVRFSNDFFYSPSLKTYDLPAQEYTSILNLFRQASILRFPGFSAMPEVPPRALGSD